MARKRCPYCALGQDKVPVSLGTVTLVFRNLRGPGTAWTVPDILDHLVAVHEFPVDQDLVDNVLHGSLVRDKLQGRLDLRHRYIGFPEGTFKPVEKKKISPLFPGILKRFMEQAKSNGFWSKYRT